MQSNPIGTDTEGTIESAHIQGVVRIIKWIEFRQNVRAFFPQGQNKLSVIVRCSY